MFIWVFTFLLHSILDFFLLTTFDSIFCSPPLRLSSVADSSEASRLQQAEGQERGGAGTNDLLAARGLRESK